MKTWVRRSLNLGVLSAGFLLVGGTAAHAADSASANNAGAADGNQVGSVLQLPVDLSGNAIGAAGSAQAQGSGGAEAGGTGSTEASTGTNAGAASGNQVGSQAGAPVTACGNSVGLLGFASGACASGGTSNGGYTESRTWSRAATAASGAGSMSTDHNAGAVSGNQVSSTVQAPVDLCGNAISLGGFASASCGSGAGGAAAATNGGGSMDTGMNAGIASGNQVANVVQVPVTVCGNSVGLLGFADATCGAGSSTGGGTGGDGTGDGNGGTGGYGDGAGALGATGLGATGVPGVSQQSTAAKAHKSHRANGANKAGRAAKKAAAKSNERSFGAAATRTSATRASGAQGLGAAGMNSTGGGTASAAGAGSMSTGTNAGALSGNQISSVVQIPLTIAGNAVAALGFAG